MSAGASVSVWGKHEPGQIGPGADAAARGLGRQPSGLPVTATGSGSGCRAPPSGPCNRIRQEPGTLTAAHRPGEVTLPDAPPRGCREKFSGGCREGVSPVCPPRLPAPSLPRGCPGSRPPRRLCRDMGRAGSGALGGCRAGKPPFAPPRKPENPPIVFYPCSTIV